MRKLVMNTFLTLDEVMQAPGGPEEDPTGGFTQGGWSVGYWDEAMGQIMGEAMSKPFELLLGRKTYEIFAFLIIELPNTFVEGRLLRLCILQKLFAYSDLQYS